MKIFKDIAMYAVALIALLSGCASNLEMHETPALHVVGVYTSSNGRIDLKITDDSRPIVLSLYAYEKTNWRILAKKGVKIEKVLLEGYHAQTVTGITADTKVYIKTYDHSPCDKCVRLGEAIGGSSKQPPVQNLKALTGLDVTSFQGRYSGAEFSIFPGMDQYKLPPSKEKLKIAVKRPIPYEGDRCPEFIGISVDDEVAGMMERSNGCEIDSIKITCEYVNGGAWETWFFNKCGKSASSVTTGGYNPKLHPNGPPTSVKKSRFADEFEKRMNKNTLALDFGNGDGLIVHGFDCDDPSKSNIVNRANTKDLHFRDNVIKHVCMPTDSGGATIQSDLSIIHIGHPWSSVKSMRQR